MGREHVFSNKMALSGSFFEQSNIPNIVKDAKYVSLGQKEGKFSAAAVELGRLRKLEDSQELADQLVSPPKTFETAEKFSWFFFMDLINFHFFYDNYDPYVVEFKGKQYVGSMGGAAAINRWLEKEPRALSPEYLSTVPAETIKEAFKDVKGIDIPMIDERIKFIHETYSKVLELKTTFYEASLKNKFDPKSMVTFLVNNFEHFSDIELYGGLLVSFHKRAQLLTKDVLTACADDIKAQGITIRLDYLSAFADYRLPQVLQHYGLLEYNEDLKAAIAAGYIEIPEMEVEIRAFTLAAVERLYHITGITPSELDTLLWKKRRSLGRSLDDRFPFHRFRTTAY